MASTEAPTSSSTSTDFETQTNPYMLPHSMIPTTILVTQPLIGSNNYSSWSKAICLVLLGKEKLGFIDGTIEKPTIEGSLKSA